MRFYAVADIHARKGRFNKIRDDIEKYRPQVLLVAGDMISFVRADPVLSCLNDMPVPVLIVRGNSDPAYVEKKLPMFTNITSLHLNPVVVRGIQFLGLSGTIPVPFRSRIRFREKALFDQMQSIVDHETILVAHPPPWGTLDEAGGKFHAGSKAMRNLIHKKQPRLYVCGHIHEASGVTFQGETMVVNCSMPGREKGALIEVGKGNGIRLEWV
ncbi:metallophosphoesterase [Desulfobacterales bacterium HSG17]|nr:metallophosphoesterase [Desulfobacterales bacterium HSG17]